MIHRIAYLAASLILVSSGASAVSNWQTIELSTSLANAPKVQAALDKLMSSVGGDLKGNVSLMASVAGGNSSHTIISSFDSRAAREAWVSKLYASDAWAEYAKATDGMIERGGTSRMNFVKSWGEDNAGADVFWEIHAFSVGDVRAFVAALDALQGSEAGKATGAQVFLSAVAAAGLAPATHLISVGFASEAQAENSSAALTATKEWATYQEASGKARTVATWGDDGR
jgi:hypothetical protein